MVTNDDGIDSEGLRALAQVCVRAGRDVLVAAPDSQASGSSAAMTATADDGRVSIKRTELPDLADVPAYAVSALPAFIAFSAVRGGFGPQPSLLVSGINLGPNTGRAVLHSGTVGAAMTAALSGVRAAAFSLDVRDAAGERHWDTAAGVAEQVLGMLPGITPGTVVNVNVPNVPPGDLRGIRAGHLALRGTFEVSVAATAEDFLQMTVQEAPGGPQPGSDSALVGAGYASVTLLRPVCEEPLADLPWPPAG